MMLKGKAMTKILLCTCKHSYQDKRYGKARRVFNSSEKDNKVYYCTVCAKEKRI